MARATVAPPPTISAWPMQVIGGLVVLRAIAIATAIALGQWSSGRPFPAWIVLLQIAVFSAPAALLLVSGRRDRRAWSLGVYFLDVACRRALVPQAVRSRQTSGACSSGQRPWRARH